MSDMLRLASCFFAEFLRKAFRNSSDGLLLSGEMLSAYTKKTTCAHRLTCTQTSTRTYTFHVGCAGYIYIYIGGWGAELNREIVSCCACVRAVCMSSEIGAKISGLPLSLFPFRLRRFSLFPSPAPQSPFQLQLALSVYNYVIV